MFDRKAWSLVQLSSLLMLVASIVAVFAGLPASASATAYKLNVRIEAPAGLGSTTVVSNPAGISCTLSSGPCDEAWFEEGTVVTLNSSGAPGVVPAHWSSDAGSFCTMVPGSDPYLGPRACKLTITADAGGDTSLAIASFPERTIRVTGSFGASLVAEFDPAWDTSTYTSAGHGLDNLGEQCGAAPTVGPGAWMPPPRPMCALWKVPSAYPVRLKVLQQQFPELSGFLSFSGWAGAGCLGTDPCTVSVVDGDTSVEAKFRSATPDWCTPAENFDYAEAYGTRNPRRLLCGFVWEDFTGVSFSGSRLSAPTSPDGVPIRVCLQGVTLRNANFRNTRGAFFGEDAIGCWQGNDLSGADLTGSDSFAGSAIDSYDHLAPFTMVGFPDQRGGLPKYDRTRFGDMAAMLAILNGADLSTAEFSGDLPVVIRFGHTFGDPAAPDFKRLPQGWNVACERKATDPSCVVLQPGWGIDAAQQAADGLTKRLHLQPITVASLFRGADLSGADLTGSDLDNVDLGAARSGASRIGGARASASARAILRNVSLVGARLSGADLRGAALSGVRSGKIRGKPKSLPKGWVLVKGYLVGPSANLRNAALLGADLRRASLVGADLSAARLRGARLPGTRIRAIKGRPKSLPAGWSLVGTTLKKGK